MVKHTQTIRRQQPKNCLSVFDYSMRLVLKGLKFIDKRTVLLSSNPSHCGTKAWHIYFWVLWDDCAERRMIQVITNRKKSSVIRQRANLETGVTRKQNTPNFPRNGYFLTFLTTYAHQWVSNVRFSENLACFVFL